MSNAIINSTASNTDLVALQALADLERQLAEAQGQQAGGGAAAITFMSAKSGMLNIEGNPVAGNKLDIIIVDAMSTNTFYAEAYDSDNITAPTCSAFGRNAGALIPLDLSTTKQAAACEGCPQNEWGSGAKGKGKACKNGLVLVFGLADAVMNGSTNLFALRLPVTSVKNFTQYSTMLAITGMNTMRVRTELSVKPDAKTQFKINFSLVEKLPVQLKLMQDILAMFTKSSIELPAMLTPTPSEEDAAPAAVVPASSKF
jgi:hypothetical protein